MVEKMLRRAKSRSEMLSMGGKSVSMCMYHLVVVSYLCSSHADCHMR